MLRFRSGFVILHKHDGPENVPAYAVDGRSKDGLVFKDAAFVLDPGKDNPCFVFPKPIDRAAIRELLEALDNPHRSVTVAREGLLAQIEA